MNFYINKLLSAIPASQRSAIKALLAYRTGKKPAHTRRELVNMLGQLSINLREGNSPKPLLESLRMTRDTNSANFNDLIQYTMLDTSIIYDELDNISQIFEGIDRLNAFDFNAIERSLSELDTRITLTQVLDSEIYSQGFTYGILDLFNGSDSASLSLESDVANTLYIDPVTNDMFSPKDIMPVSTSVEGLILPSDSSRTFPIDAAYVSAGFNTTETDYEFTATDNAFVPSNVVNSLRYDDNSIWSHFVFIERGRTHDSPIDTVKAELILDLGGIATTNTISMSNSSPYSLTIDNILYEAPDSQLYTLVSGPITVNSREGYTAHYSTVSASKLYIQMSQEIYTTVKSVVKDTGNGPYVELPDDLSELGGSIANIAVRQSSGSPERISRRLNGWLYTFAIEQIEISYNRFRERGVYVSKPLTVDGVATHAAIDALVAESESMRENQGDNVEFWLHKFDYSKNNSLLKHIVVPALPARISQITHRALLFNQNGVARFPFVPSDEMRIYKDFTLLTIGDDYQLSIGNGATGTYNTINPPSGLYSGPPYSVLIMLTDMDPSSIYTISCEIERSNISASVAMYMDRGATAVLGGDSIYSFKYPSGYLDEVDHSDLYLVIIARSLDHDAFYRSSPIIFHYGLYAG